MPQALCIVPGCDNHGDHLLPANRQRRFIWLEAIRADNPELEDWNPKPNVKYLYLCRAHFKEDDYNEEQLHGKLGKRKVLLKTAVPSVFSWSSTSTGDIGEDFGLMKTSTCSTSTQENEEEEWQTTSKISNKEDSKRQLIYSSIISQHADHLLTKLYVQFIKRRNCDLIIKLADIWLYAHTCVVDAFTNTGGHAQLRFENTNSGKSVLDLGPFQCDVILPLVEMMYTGELAVMPSLVEEVARAAKFIGFQEAYKGCELYMKLHNTGQGQLDENTTNPGTEIHNQLYHSVAVESSPKTKKQKSSSAASSPAPVKLPALKIKGKEPVKIKKNNVKGMVYVKGKNKTQSAGKGKGKIKAKSESDITNQDADEEQDAEKELEVPIKIKQEPLDEFDSPLIENTGSEEQEDNNYITGMYKSVTKTEVSEFPEEMPGTSDYPQPAFLDQSKTYAGNWAKNTMNLNEEFVSRQATSKNVYTVLPYKPTDREVYSSKKRGRPRDSHYVPAADGYLANSAEVGMEVDDIPIQFDYDASSSVAKYGFMDEEEIDKVAKELATELAAQVTEKRNSKSDLKVKIKGKRKSGGTIHPPKVEDGSFVSDYGNTFTEVKTEPVDNGYEQNNAEVQAASDHEESESDNESIGRRRSKRRRTSRRSNFVEYDYNSDSDDTPRISKPSTKQFQTQCDDEYLESTAKQKDSKNSEYIINPNLLKGSRFVGTICQTSEQKRQKPAVEPENKNSKKVLKNYLESIGLPVKNFNETDSESEGEPIEVDAGVKVIPPVAIVPKGTRTRYAQPHLAQVKEKFVKTHKGGMKKVASIIKTKPKIFQGHQQKPNPGPVYVMCHPTKPIVRL